MNLSISGDKLMSFALAALAIYTAALVPADAWAGISGSVNLGGVKISGSSGGGGGCPEGIANVLTTVVGWFTGTIGKALATLAIIVVGIGALMGKVSWGMAIIVGIGVGVIFGASNIVEVLGGSGDGC